MSDIDLKKYQEFVDAVTSQESKNNNDFQTRWTILQNQRDAKVPCKTKRATTKHVKFL